MPDPPRSDQVLVWWMDVATLAADIVERWHAALDAGLQARADRLRFPADRAACIGAHTLARALLSHVGALPATAWRFVTGPWGKPHVDPALGVDLGFNLSHARGLVAAAVCAGSSVGVGVDVEACDRQDVGIELARRYFAPSEVAALHATVAHKRQETFFRLWTLKESYIKATGLGLSCPLDSFSFTLDPIRVSFRPDVGDEPDNWQFFQRRPTRGHVLAVAVRRPPGRRLQLLERAVAQHAL